MDKKTIIKYKKEFDAWLEDKPVLCRYRNETHHKDIGWMKLNENANFFTDNCIYILNDNAVELRKASASGKDIEFYQIIEEVDENPENDIYKWKVNKRITSSYAFNKDISLYRIKD